jgi:hypothetical protein
MGMDKHPPLCKILFKQKTEGKRSTLKTATTEPGRKWQDHHTIFSFKKKNSGEPVKNVLY